MLMQHVPSDKHELPLQAQRWSWSAACRLMLKRQLLSYLDAPELPHLSNQCIWRFEPHMQLQLHLQHAHASCGRPCSSLSAVRSSATSPSRQSHSMKQRLPRWCVMLLAVHACHSNSSGSAAAPAAMHKTRLWLLLSGWSGSSSMHAAADSRAVPP